MPTLTGTLTAITGGTVDTSQVRRAYVRAPRHRASLGSAGGLVVTVPVPVPTSGELSIDLDLGPAILVVDMASGGLDVFDLHVTEDMTLITEALAEAAPPHERSWAESQMVQLRGEAVAAAGAATGAAGQTAEDRAEIELLRANLVEAAEQNAAPHLTTTALNATYMRSAPPEGAEFANLGPELYSGGSWAVGRGWTGDATTGFTYTYPGSGGVGADFLNWTPSFTPTVGATYLVSFTANETGGMGRFQLAFGGQDASIIYQGAPSVFTYERAITTSSTDGFVIRPIAVEFSGSTLSNFSIREVLGTNAPTSTWQDANGVPAVEFRSDVATRENVFFGYEAGRRNLTGVRNVGVGSRALRANVTGFWNVALGRQSMEANTSGSRNVAAGVYSLMQNTSGHRNVALGPFAMRDNKTGFANIALGVDVMWSLISGSYNIAMGQSALTDLIDGTHNVGIGHGSLRRGASLNGHIGIGQYAGAEVITDTFGGAVMIGHRAGQYATRANTYIGNEAGRNSADAFDGVAVGHMVLHNTGSASHNVGVGAYAGQYIAGERNTLLGRGAGRGVSGSTTGVRNVAIGYAALQGMTTGSRNIAAGDNAGSAITTGSDNIILGANVQVPSPTDSFYLNVGNLLYGRMGASQKQLGVNVTTPTASLHLPASPGTAGRAPLKFTSGTLLAAPETGAVEFDGSKLYVTISGVRREIAFV